jgi:hypothetical protein
MSDLDVVAVATGTRHYSFSRLIEGITDAVKSSEPLPENEAARSALDLSIADAATERPSPVGAIPETAKQVLGKVYHFVRNVLNLRSLALNLSDVDPSFEFVNGPSSSTTTNHRDSGPLGLDGTYRTGGRARFGVNAAKASWQDDKTFVLELHTLGNDDARQFYAHLRRAECRSAVPERVRLESQAPRHNRTDPGRQTVTAREERNGGCRFRKRPLYSITSSARASSAGGKVRPSAFAVCRLIRSWNLVA